MTQRIFESLTRRLLIATSVVFGVYGGITLKDDMLHRIGRHEIQRLMELRRLEHEASLLRFPAELKLDEEETSQACVGTPGS